MYSNSGLLLVGGVCGGLIVLVLAVVGIVLVVTGARGRNKPGGRSSAGLIIGIICLVIGACMACSLLACLLNLALNAR